MTRTNQYGKEYKTTPNGNRMEPKYKKDKKGKLVKTGEVDIYEKIQANRQSANIGAVIRGEAIPLNLPIEESKLMYEDVTGMPKDLIEANMMAQEAAERREDQEGRKSRRKKEYEDREKRMKEEFEMKRKWEEKANGTREVLTGTGSKNEVK